ncbi:MAG TPA: hypothetical protein ENG22_00825, partial [Candidatus Bathyarchaeota archaeon]|nr:hypothetical protein [Candidatus Bathyarchaeota archaeon]
MNEKGKILRDLRRSRVSLQPVSKVFPFSFKNVICGGTFDMLHEGHRFFLGKSITYAKENLTIGVTSDRYVSKFKKVKTQPYIVRAYNVRRFVRKRALFKNINIKIIQINDFLGPLKSDRRKYLLIVTPDMVEKVVAINLLRRRSSLPEVYAVFIPFLKNSTGKRFSSTR